MTPNQSTMQVFKEALSAVVNGPFIPEWEFSILFGVERIEVSRVLEALPESLTTKEGKDAIAGAVNNLVGYPHGLDNLWSQYITVSREELWEIYQEWCTGNECQR